MICEKCKPRELEAMRALESLTPSGSEFVNDPKRCAEFAKDQMRTVVKFAGEAKQLRKALLAAVPFLFEPGPHQTSQCYRGSDDGCFCGLDEAKKLMHAALERT